MGLMIIHGFDFFIHTSFYKPVLLKKIMAATAPGARKKKLDYTVDGAVFDDFMKACSRKGYAPQVILELAMKKFIQNGAI